MEGGPELFDIDTAHQILGSYCGPGADTIPEPKILSNEGEYRGAESCMGLVFLNNEPVQVHIAIALKEEVISDTLVIKAPTDWNIFNLLDRLNQD